MTTAQESLTREIIERHDQFMVGNLNRYPVAMVRGQGSRLWDAQGRAYLDLFAGFGGSILGHAHPDLVRAVSAQAAQLWHVGNLFHTEPQTHLAEHIAKKGFGGRSLFSHCGADANEAALKLARLYGKARPGRAAGAHGRYKVLSTIHSFHGRFFGSMMATGQDKVRHGFEPLLPGFGYVPYNDLAAMAKAIDGETVAIMVEPIQGEGGINMPGEAYLAGLRRLCEEHDLVLIFDEVWTGCGRTARWFAYQHWNVTPDIMTLAKGVGGGLPVGVMCAGPKVAEYFTPRVNHGVVAHATTLGGNCLSMAVAVAVFEVIERDGLLAHAAALEKQAVDRLTAFARTHPQVKTVRGKGVFLGIELDPKAPGAWFKSATEVVSRCMDQGVLINGTQDVVLRLAPPLVLTPAELHEGLDVIERIIAGV